MKIINTAGFPKPLYDFLCQDFYDHEAAEGTYSVTTLMKPPQEVALTRRHWDDIEVEAEKRLWSVFGSAVHAVLERLHGSNIKPIERLVVTLGFAKVSGKFDLIEGSKLSDWKVTSVWTILYGDRRAEWREQLSAYRWLYWKVKGEVLDDIGCINAILRDWKKSDMGKPGYPQTPAITIDINLMSLVDTERWIYKRAKLHVESEKLHDDSLPSCSEEERWWNPKKKVNVKCADYCDAAKFCKQYAAIRAGQEQLKTQPKPRKEEMPYGELFQADKS